MRSFRLTAAAAALLAGLGTSYAQPAQQDAHHPDTAAPAVPQPAAPPAGMAMDKMMGGDMSPMMAMMQKMMMRSMAGSGMPTQAGLRHIEGQIAFYRAELRISDAQAAVWNAFSDALRAGAKPLQEAFAAAAQATSVPEQLAARRQMLTAELASLQSIEPAARDLYAALSAEQKKTADEFMADHLRRM